jgi:hypothetical protein
MLRRYFQGNERGHCQEYTGDSPKTRIQPHRQQDDERVDLEPMADREWLHDLPLDQMQHDEAAGGGQCPAQLIERSERGAAENDDRGSRSKIRNEVEQGRDHSPKDGVGHPRAATAAAVAAPNPKLMRVIVAK